MLVPVPPAPPSSRGVQLPPPEAWIPALKLARLARRPLERFLRIQAAGGLVLMFCALLALGVANSRYGPAYAHFWHTPIALEIGTLRFARPLEWVVNDGLMAIFFFVVGMEIRRESADGELSEWRRAALPAAAALGGMVMPALIYLLVVRGVPEVRTGWGVPMATDIAFALGVLALLGKRVPPALRVLLLALAVIDDLGAIIVIALFYSKGIVLAGFGIAGAGLLLIVAMRSMGVRSRALYVAPAIVVWAGTYAAGIHPTIAGVLVGLLTPVHAWLGTEGARQGLQKGVRLLGDAGELPEAELDAVLRQVDDVRREAVSPAEGLIARLNPWIAFGVMPLFALANAGVSVSGAGVAAGPSAQLALAGAAAGLLLGKPLGILLASMLAVRLRLATLPLGLGRRHLLVLGLAGGIGFTMALFVAQLAFTDAVHLAYVKLGVLGASAVAALLALVVGRALLPSEVHEGSAETADEAEASTER